MKRENLDFLDNEQIDKVMALYGKAIAKKDSEIDKLTDSNKELTDKVLAWIFSITFPYSSASLSFPPLNSSIDKASILAILNHSFLFTISLAFLLFLVYLHYLPYPAYLLLG